MNNAIEAYCNIEFKAELCTELERRMYNQIGIDRYIYFRYQWCDFRGRLYHI